mgnify:CR=1 FL=1
MSDTKSLRIERQGSLGWIVLDRPNQINAINDEIRHGVPRALKELDSDPQVSVIALRGAGGRGFCVGADIKETRGEGSETSSEIRRRMQNSRWIESLDVVAKPVIAAIHGYCLGGGLELALACDIRIATPDSVFALPEVKLGLIPGGGGTQRLPRLVGLGRALEMLLTGRRVPAGEALAMGLISRLSASDSSLVEEVVAVAGQLAESPPMALAYVKRAARSALDTSLSRGCDSELDLFSLLATTEDRREAAIAFKEKRPPRFRGS